MSPGDTTSTTPPSLPPPTSSPSVAVPSPPTMATTTTTMTTTTTDLQPEIKKKSGASDYAGFVSGIFSGIAKVTVGHPFDTVKVRLQTTDAARFTGPLQCLTQTVRNEGVLGLYKGVTPPLVGWMFMDSILMGSLTVYRRLMAEHVFSVPVRDLQPLGHGFAGLLAGATVSFVAAPVEHVKARLQIQYAARKADRLYSGPWDCARRIYAHHGAAGVYHGLGATLFFRSFMFFWWSSYDVLTRWMSAHTSLSAPAVNFWAGGLSAQVFWLTSYPADLVKQRLMTDPLGGGLGDGQRQFYRWTDAARAVYRESGWKGYWRGFVPCFLRAFPANATALMVFEGVMRTLS